MVDSLKMANPAQQSIFLVSSCLTGLCTRYDNTIKHNTECSTFLKNHICIPICPEQLGGLSTPRTPANITGGDGHDVLQGKATVCSRDGTDLTAAFIHGAKQVLHIAESQAISGICLKARSPSCAVSGTIGVTAALLQQNGFTLYEF